MSTAHDLVFAAITGDATLNSLGITAESCWAAGSFDGPQPVPFMVMRWGVVTRGYGAANTTLLTVYVHDEPGSYDRIRAIQRRMRAVLLALEATGTPVNWIINVQWNGESGDLSDDSYRTITRNSDFTVVANTL